MFVPKMFDFEASLVCYCRGGGGGWGRTGGGRELGILGIWQDTIQILLDTIKMQECVVMWEGRHCRMFLSIILFE